MAKDDNTLSLSDSDIVGVVQRGIAELAVHLNQPTNHINGPACVAHLERMMMVMSRLPAPAANGNAPEAMKKAS